MRDNAQNPWVLVAGGFHERGAMDRANAAVADYLISRGTPVHLVGHDIDERFKRHPGVRIYPVPRPLDSFLLGEALLQFRARKVARRVSRSHPRARVLVNGGNAVWPDVNWVHSVHHVWPSVTAGAPGWFVAKAAAAKAWARWRERSALEAATMLVVNSHRTRLDVISTFRVRPDAVQMVYLGVDPEWGDPSPAERVTARSWLRIPAGQPVVAFVGALSYDRNKGFDTMWAAWQRLSENSDWDAWLVVAGGGNGLKAWQNTIDQSGHGDRVRVLGHTDRIRDLLAASDLLVSPVRYEAYGLNVQEAVARGVPAMVSATAGIAERYPDDVRDFVLPRPDDDVDLARRLSTWRRHMKEWPPRFRPFVNLLRRHTWRDMAGQIIEIAERNTEREVGAIPAVRPADASVRWEE